MAQPDQTIQIAFPRARWWWLVLALLLVLASWLYFPGYDTSLPYIDNPNEPAFNLAAQTIIDTGSARSISFDAYPPGIISLNYLLIKYFKAEDAHFSSVLTVLRLITISVWLCCVVVIALIGTQVARPMTGLIAAAIWITNPWVVAQVRFAEANGFVTCFTLFSLWLALAGALHGRRSYSTAAIYVLMIAVLFKTQALLIAPLVWSLPMVNLMRDGAEQREILRQLFWNAIRLGLFVLWLFLLYPTLEADRIPFWVAPSHSLAIPSPQILWTHLQLILNTTTPLITFFGILFAGLSLVWNRLHINPISLGTVILAATAWLLGVSLFGKQDLRQFYVLAALMTVVYALGWTWLTIFAGKAIDRLGLAKLSSPIRRVLAPTIVALILAAGMAPSFNESNRIAHNFTLHDRRNDLMRYMDTSLPPGKYISDRESPNHKVTNRSWGGYDGVHDYPLAQEVWHLLDKPLETWRDKDAVYAILPYPPRQDDPHIYFPDETVLLKSYPPDPNVRGPSMVVLRLYPMQYETDGQLGPIWLVGYDINATELEAGQDIVLRHYWQADSPTNAVHHVYNHLLNDDGEIVAQVDYVPLWNARRPTTTWDDPDEILLGRQFILNLPADLPAATYQLISGLYDPATWQRLLSPDGADHIEIIEIAVHQLET